MQFCDVLSGMCIKCKVQKCKLQVSLIRFSLNRPKGQFSLVDAMCKPVLKWCKHGTTLARQEIQFLPYAELIIVLLVETYIQLTTKTPNVEIIISWHCFSVRGYQ